MSDLFSGVNRWIMIGLIVGYIFMIWAIVSVIIGFIFENFTMLILCGVFASIFMVYDIIAYLKKKDEIYEEAGLSKWSEDITYLDDLGNVAIAQNRIASITPLNTDYKTIKKQMDDPEFKRIKLALLADKMEMERKLNDIEEQNIDKNSMSYKDFDIIDDMEKIDEKRMLQEFNEDDPRRFKRRYFRIENIIDSDKTYLCETTKVDKKKNQEKDIEEKDLDFEKIISEEDKEIILYEEADKPVEIPKTDSTDTTLKDELKKLDKDVQENIDSGTEKIDDENVVSYDEDQKEKPEESEDEEEIEDNFEEEDIFKGFNSISIKSLIKGHYCGIPILKLQDEFQKTIELNKNLVTTTIMKSQAGIHLLLKYKRFKYKMLGTNEIIILLRKNKILTVEDLRNCDKIVIAKGLGFTNEEMKEFVKYCEKILNDKEIKFWRDLLPDELKYYHTIKMIEVKIECPQTEIVLVTFAEPVEYQFPKRVIAKPFIHVKGQKKRMPPEFVTRRFEQVIYELPDDVDRCLNFAPGGRGILDGYPVNVPMAYGTLVLKGAMNSAVPILKLIATNYEVTREFDDYKNHLAHQSSLLKCYAGYVNHIVANSKMLNDQIDADTYEVNAIQSEMERLNQMKKQREFVSPSGGSMTDDAISALLGGTDKNEQKEQKNDHKGLIIGILLIAVVVIAIIGLAANITK